MLVFSWKKLLSYTDDWHKWKLESYNFINIISTLLLFTISVSRATNRERACLIIDEFLVVKFIIFTKRKTVSVISMNEIEFKWLYNNIDYILRFYLKIYSSLNLLNNIIRWHSIRTLLILTVMGSNLIIFIIFNKY